MNRTLRQNAGALVPTLTQALRALDGERRAQRVTIPAP
jgi:hypothetical protein